MNDDRIRELATQGRELARDVLGMFAFHVPRMVRDSDEAGVLVRATILALEQQHEWALGDDGPDPLTDEQRAVALGDEAKVRAILDELGPLGAEG